MNTNAINIKTDILIYIAAKDIQAAASDGVNLWNLKA